MTVIATQYPSMFCTLCTIGEVEVQRVRLIVGKSFPLLDGLSTAVAK